MDIDMDEMHISGRGQDPLCHERIRDALACVSRFHIWKFAIAGGCYLQGFIPRAGKKGEGI
jgi:hypothetical protein